MSVYMRGKPLDVARGKGVNIMAKAKECCDIKVKKVKGGFEIKVSGKEMEKCLEMCMKNCCGEKLGKK
jgi:hypothetical protein